MQLICFHTFSEFIAVAVSVVSLSARSNCLICHYVYLHMCVTCLSSSDESCVSLTVLPVDIQMWTLRQRYDDVHVTLIGCNQQPYLKRQVTGEEIEMDELKDQGNGKRLKGEISKNVQREKRKNLPKEMK